MKIDFKSLLSKKMNTKELVIIFIIGVILLLLPGHSKSQPTDKAGSEATVSGVDRAVYEKELETRLSAILSTLKGVSDVSVMITLEDCGETYYAHNEKTNEQSGGEGSRADSLQTDGSLALKSEAGGGQSPVLLKTGMPRISGVLVTAAGAGSPAAQTNIMNAVRAVLDVSPHRIQVLEKA